MIVLASTKNASRTPGSKRKEHDPAGDLPLLAVKSMAALLHLCPNALSLQKCMASLPPAADNGPTPGMEKDFWFGHLLKVTACEGLQQSYLY